MSIGRKRLRNEDETEKADEGDIKRINNSIFFHCEVSRNNVLQLIEKLHEAKNEANKFTPAIIRLYIHSEGGDAYAGLSAMNHIQTLGIPVFTIADGFVASAATFMLLAGVKRFAMPNSTILIHQFSTTFWGKYADLIDELENSHQLMKSFRALYSNRTHLKKKN